MVVRSRHLLLLDLCEEPALRQEYAERLPSDDQRAANQAAG